MAFWGRVKSILFGVPEEEEKKDWKALKRGSLESRTDLDKAIEVQKRKRERKISNMQ
jgi:hypothetical protein